MKAQNILVERSEDDNETGHGLIIFDTEEEAAAVLQNLNGRDFGGS